MEIKKYLDFLPNNFRHEKDFFIQYNLIDFEKLSNLSDKDINDIQRKSSLCTLNNLKKIIAIANTILRNSLYKNGNKPRFTACSRPTKNERWLIPHRNITNAPAKIVADNLIKPVFISDLRIYAIINAEITIPYKKPNVGEKM